MFISILSNNSESKFKQLLVDNSCAVKKMTALIKKLVFDQIRRNSTENHGNILATALHWNTVAFDSTYYIVSLCEQRVQNNAIRFLVLVHQAVSCGVCETSRAGGVRP
ncbi:hypothetical protein XENOCAPTIV_016079 [Xenoophorus captivus]|uniref:Uncharacterized protein n=1 Tax=Xenoophorus captivus TaxID=1517983 RepID=A0ABV0S8K2_9TELE